LKSICVIGLGYIGLPTTLLLKKSYPKLKVAGFDTSLIKIQELSKGRTAINEYEIKYLLKKLNKSIIFSNKIISSDCYMICVPTPISKRKVADLSYVYNAARQISSILKKGDTIILESTVPVGTTENLVKYLKNKNKKINFELNNSDINIIFSPERVLPGNIIHELMYNKRVVGVRDDKSKIVAKSFFNKMIKSEINFTTLKMAEMIKLSENTYRDINIAYANLLSLICDEHKIDYKKLINFSNQHPRVNILQPGIGVGGHCIPIDPYFLAQSYKKNELIISARKVNNIKTLSIIKKIKRIIKEKKSLSSVIFLGASYKPNSDDIRESPAVKIIEYFLRKKKYKIKVYDPNINYLPNKLSTKNVYLETNLNIKKTDLVIKLIDHNVFKNFKKKYSNIQIIDFT